MPTASSNRAVTVIAVLALLTAAVGPTVGTAAQQDYEVADGRTGSVEPGREDDEEQVFPINYTFVPLNRQPAAKNTGFEVFASGLTENITGHWVVLESADFGFSSCTAGDASVFGIDRGNDDAGTTTDRSLLTAYKSYTSTPGGIYIEFYKESALAGEPVEAYVVDQVVARQNNCVTNPDEPGWYRLHGHINGSTKHDTTTDYEISAGTQYVYICDCDSRQQARETLGPPPNEQESGSDPTATATATATAEPTGTATAKPESTVTPTATATPTPARGTPTEAANQDQQQQDPGRDTVTRTATAPGTASQGTGGPATTRRTAQQTATTPTLAEGPGFGSVVALLAVAGAGLFALRRKN